VRRRDAGSYSTTRLGHVLLEARLQRDGDPPRAACRRLEGEFCGRRLARRIPANTRGQREPEAAARKRNLRISILRGLPIGPLRKRAAGRNLGDRRAPSTPAAQEPAPPCRSDVIVLGGGAAG